MPADERWTVHDGGAFVRDVQASPAGALHEASSTKLRGLISQMATFLDAPAIANLGAGASGQVGLCKTVVGGGNEKLVARKRIHISAIAPSGLAQVEREVEVLKKLRHPHCIHYFGSCLNGDTLEILMDYAAGGALSNAIKSRRADGRHFGTPIVIRWLEQLMSATSHVHRKGILHRDIKASNIFLSEPLDPGAARIPSIKLGDFGLASEAEATGSREGSPHKCTAAASADKARSRAKGPVCGTPNYISPELIVGEPHSCTSDTWAFGVVLFELLTLKRPFVGRSLDALYQRVLAVDYDRTAITCAPHPQWIRDLVLKTFDPNPVERVGCVGVLESVAIATLVGRASSEPCSPVRRRSSSMEPCCPVQLRSTFSSFQSTRLATAPRKCSKAVQGGDLEMAQRGGNIFSEYAHGGLPIPGIVTTTQRTRRAAPGLTKKVDAGVLKKPVPSAPPPPPSLQRGLSAASMSGPPPPQHSPPNQSSRSDGSSLSLLFNFDETGFAFDHVDSSDTGTSSNLVVSGEAVRQSPDD